MANQTPYADNVSGKYYVDYDCIELCSEIASQNFRPTINNQPTPIPYDSCPVEAIGNDGI